MRPSTICTCFTPLFNAFTHASTFGSMPLEMAPLAVNRSMSAAFKVGAKLLGSFGIQPYPMRI